MTRTPTTTLVTVIILIVLAVPLVAEEPETAPTVEGALESAYRSWTQSLPDDGTWELEMPPAHEAEDLDHLQRTILDSGTRSDLVPARKAGYLVALADRTALEGDRTRARSLYQVLGTSRVSLLRMWSVYMLAGLDFAQGHYAIAADGYDRVCQESAPADWRDHACSMAELAGRLDVLQLEGGDHGDSVVETP